MFESGETLAHIYMNNPDEEIGRWTLGINEENIELVSETMVTYIHEYAHLLSLRDEQVDYYVDEESCVGGWIDELCFYDDAYVKQFYDTFYTTEQPLTFDAYVSDYAMTDASEDFAETFAHFVLTPMPDDMHIVDNKMLFFYRYPQLVSCVRIFYVARRHGLKQVLIWNKKSEPRI